MAFIDTPRFPDCLSLGAVGGPGWSTEVVIVASGQEQRNQNWDQARRRYDVSHANKDETNKNLLVDWHHAMRGRTHGFRFKDWLDFVCVEAAGQIIGDGTPYGQLYKLYTIGTETHYRIITKLVSGTVTIYLASVPQPAIVPDVNAGTIALTATAIHNITNITTANPAVVTIGTHSFTNGQKIWLNGIGGMTQLNTHAYTISGVTASTFSIPVSTIGTTYTTGGTASLYPQGVLAYNWAGEFDVPVRFDSDLMQMSVDFVANLSVPASHYSWPQILLLELRYPYE